jgi:hypothetical protein
MSAPVFQSPYTTTPVKDPRMFFGRERVLNAIIEERAKSPHGLSTIVVGGRKIGKTSLLNQIEGRILAQPACLDGTKLVPTYLTLQGFEKLEPAGFYSHIVALIVKCVQEQYGVQVDNLSPSNGHDAYQHFCVQLGDVLDCCAETVGTVRFVILLDEADRLLGQTWTNDVISNLRDLINTSHLKDYVILVITGFRELHDFALTEIEGIGSPLGSDVRWTCLGVLSKDELQALVSVPIDGKILPDAIEQVYSASGGHAWVAQYLMHESFRLTSEQITAEHIRQASNKFNEEVRVFDSWYGKFTELDRQVYRTVACTQGPLLVSEVQEKINNGIERGTIKDSLDFLSYAGVVAKNEDAKNGDRYCVSVQLFRDWFLARHSNKGASDAMKKQEQPSGFDIKRLVVSAVVVLTIFVVTVVMLVWASQQVPPTALVFIILVSVVFNLVLIVTVLVSIGILRQKWAMDFYNSVLKAVPSLASIFGVKSPAQSSQSDSEDDEDNAKSIVTRKTRH